MSGNSDEATAPGADWDALAASFDDEPDHGLRDAEVRRAWAARLEQYRIVFVF